MTVASPAAAMTPSQTQTGYLGDRSEHDDRCAPVHGCVFLVAKSAAVAALRCFTSRSIAASMPMTV
jgi:hypothetical protein